MWVREASKVTISENTITDFRTGIHSSQATIHVADNTIQGFVGTAIVIKDSRKPAHVTGNVGRSTHIKPRVVDVQGPSGIIDNNRLIEEPRRD